MFHFTTVISNLYSKLNSYLPLEDLLPPKSSPSQFMAIPIFQLLRPNTLVSSLISSLFLSYPASNASANAISSTFEICPGFDHFSLPLLLPPCAGHHHPPPGSRHQLCDHIGHSYPTLQPVSTVSLALAQSTVNKIQALSTFQWVLSELIILPLSCSQMP